MHGASVPQIVAWASNVVVIGAATFNIIVARRNVKLAHRLRDDHRDLVPNIIDAITATAARACPLCGSTQGHGGVHAERNDGLAFLVEAEEEQDGKHELRARSVVGDLPDQLKTVPCAAAPLRELARKLFNDYMETKEGSRGKDHNQ